MAGAEARAKAREAGTRACEAEPGRARVTFRRALRSEAVRMRRSPLVVLHVALAVALGALALAGRSLPDTAAVALATAGIALGSLCSYAILWCVALRFGRNASIGMGTLGFIAALTLMGGLANGLVTGTFSGAFSIGAAAFVPFAWPSRLASLPLELSIAAGMGAQAQVEALAAAYATVTCACTAITAVVLAVALAAANRFENPRRSGE